MFQVFVSTTLGQSSTPVPILKQINRQNEDGSYSYGYENADGSYKIETKSAAGEISGKYGYVDEFGKLREIEYGASKRGFEPVGPGITVPPPTLHVENGNAIEDYDDGQYREDPSIYYKTDKPLTTSGKFRINPIKVAPHAPHHQNAPAVPAAASFSAAPSFRYESHYQAQPQHVDYRWYRPAPSNVPQYVNPAVYQGHPATNLDLYSGSYTVNY